MRRSGREILSERARELAQPRAREEAAGCVLLPFEAGGERYALDVRDVHQVVDSSQLHPLLGVPPPVIGAILARTRPVPVLDVRQVLGLAGADLADLQRVIVVEDQGDLYGLAVERVGRRIELSGARLQPSDTGFLRWTAPGRLGVLDVARLGVDGERS